jgi:GDP-L-fucose synthase
MDTSSVIYVAGPKTLIGAALIRELKGQGYWNVVGGQEGEPDLIDATQVDDFFRAASPEYVFLTGGKSGGIQANQNYPAQLIRDNLLTDCHVIHSAYRHGVKKLLYFASSCSYPKHASQPMQVESLLTGPLEPTNEAYAVAKIAGIKMCQAYRQEYGADFISAIPANPFGPGDDFSPESSHVVPALIRRMHEGKQRGAETIDIWGTGTPRREFILADDVANASIFIMQGYGDLQPINIGGGWDLSIREVANLIKDVVGYRGEFHFDTRKPDGMPVKLMDWSKLRAMGWRPKTDVKDAISATYQWFLEKEA